MRVSFLGIQNASAQYQPGLFSNEGFAERLLFELNNDGKRDLDENQDLLEKYPDIFKSNFIDYRAYTTYNDITKQNNTRITVNSNLLDTKNDEDMRMLTKINSLIKRISNGEQAPLTDKYLYSDQFVRRIGSADLGLKSKKHQISILKDMSIPNIVQTVSKSLTKSADKILGSYYSQHNDYFSGAKNIKGFVYKDEKMDLTRLIFDPSKETKIGLRKLLLAQHPNRIYIDMYKKGLNRPTTIYVNDVTLEPSPENFEAIRSISKILNEMSETKSDFHFPDDALSRPYFSEMAKKTFSPFFLIALYEQTHKSPKEYDPRNEDCEDEEEYDVNFNLCEKNDDVKAITKDLADEINKMMEKALFG